MIKEFISKYDKRTLRRGTIALVIYLLWVIWLGNYWFLLGLPIVFDMYISKKVNWSPWKKREGKNSAVVEWIDALIFAVIAVTIINIFLFQNYKIPTGSMEKSLQIGDHLYVSKIAYGPRIPMTPISLPFMQHTIPGTSTKSFIDWPRWDYKRLKGFGKVKRWDPVVFNFPEGDTVCFEKQNVSYYSIIRDRIAELKYLDSGMKKPLRSEKEYYAEARNYVWNNYTVIVRPIDKEDNYIKRCVGIAGDSLQIIDGVIYINGVKEPDVEGRQYLNNVYTNGNVINKRTLQKIGIYNEDIHWSDDRTILQVPLTQKMKKEVTEMRMVSKVEQFMFAVGEEWPNMFPNDNIHKWNLDQFGPIYIPKAGVTINLNLENLGFYERIIDQYENNDLEVKDSTIFINGKPATTYTFKMNYYWMMGDNRHSSLDSRYWGYVPEDHIIGKPRFIWLSLNQDKKFPANIQFSRMFRPIH